MSSSQEPLDHKPRTLILCFDGTSNEYDADNTNVVKLFSLFKKDYDQQLCYYQAGIGTYFEPGLVSPLFEWCAKVLDLAFAWYLDTHVTDGYKFLMQNYRPGDKICIFGFSRGAYTARALGGLLYKVGLLPRDNEAQVPFAYRMYKRTDDEGLKLCAGFKQTYCQDVKIEFMGVWDTVASVGVVAGRTLPFTNSNSSIKTFRHALSLDERRVKFLPNNYHRPSPNPEAAKADPEHASKVMPVVAQELADPDTKPKDTVKSEKKKKRNSMASVGSSSSSGSDGPRAARWGFFGRGMTMKVKEAGKYVSPAAAIAEDDGECDDVLEVWFSGCHSDVGGGEVSNETVNSLANLSLRWMVREIQACALSVQWDSAALERANITLSPEPTAAELDLDETDAVQPLHDELSRNKLWWILEILPLQTTYQDADGVWHTSRGFHLGKGRKIVDPQPNFHTSVQARMASTLKYKPKAQWASGTEIYLH